VLGSGEFFAKVDGRLKGLEGGGLGGPSFYDSSLCGTEKALRCYKEGRSSIKGYDRGDYRVELAEAEWESGALS